MKKNISLFLVLIPILFMSCRKDDKLEMSGITGRWKLEKVERYSSVSGEMTVADHTDNQITYRFNSNGRLVISEDVQYHTYHSPGTFRYTLRLDEFNPTIMFNYILEIGDRVFRLHLDKGTMILKLNPVDPLALYASEYLGYFTKLD